MTTDDVATDRFHVLLLGYRMIDDTSGEVIRQIPVAMLARFYGKIHTQKKRRNEFLSSVIRSFDIHKV
jgi:xanthine dehydrogenase iron-sulfur cluster and FAD-binding subunit A